MSNKCGVMIVKYFFIRNYYIRQKKLGLRIS